MPFDIHKYVAAPKFQFNTRARQSPLVATRPGKDWFVNRPQYRTELRFGEVINATGFPAIQIIGVDRIDLPRKLAPRFK